MTQWEHNANCLWCIISYSCFYANVCVISVNIRLQQLVIQDNISLHAFKLDHYHYYYYDYVPIYLLSLISCIQHMWFIKDNHQVWVKYYEDSKRRNLAFLLFLGESKRCFLPFFDQETEKATDIYLNVSLPEMKKAFKTGTVLQSGNSLKNVFMC